MQLQFAPKKWSFQRPKAASNYKYKFTERCFIFSYRIQHRIWEQIYYSGGRKEKREEKCQDLNTGLHFGRHFSYFVE